MNLKEIITSTQAYNFHSHTQFCDGRAEMARFVETAISARIKYYGFTPHSPIPFESPCNMDADRVDEYISEFKRLKSLYADKIELFLSMEIDYIGAEWGASHPYFKNLPLDYRLSSIHFIPTPDGNGMIDIDGRPEGFITKMHKYFHDDIKYVVNTFYRQTIAMIEAGGFDIIGHFDKIGFNASCFQPGIENEEWYKKNIDDIIDLIKSSDIIVEVNTKAWIPPVGSSREEISRYVPRLFPSANVIHRLIDGGVTLVVNSDAHYPERISAGRNEAFDIIHSLS